MSKQTFFDITHRTPLYEGFLRQVEEIKKRSPDGQTQCGALITGRDNRVLSQGYNGGPRSVDNSLIPNMRPDKYPWFIHAEMNALANLQHIPRNSDGGICYISREPCFNCLLMLWQFGIDEVHHLNLGGWNDEEKNIEERKLKAQLLEWTGMVVFAYDGKFFQKQNYFKD